MQPSKCQKILKRWIRKRVYDNNMALSAMDVAQSAFSIFLVKAMGKIITAQLKTALNPLLKTGNAN